MMYSNKRSNRAIENIKSNQASYNARITMIDYNIDVARIIMKEFNDFLSGGLSKINNPIIFKEKKTNLFIFNLPDVINHKKTTHKKVTEVILHGDIKSENGLYYGPEQNKKYCDPNNRPENKLLNQDKKDEENNEYFYIREEKYLIFKYLQTFIFKMYGVYMYDASRIMSNEKYYECAKEEQKKFDSKKEYLGIIAYCSNTTVSIIFSRTELKREDLEDSEDFLWFEQPNNNFWFEKPGNYYGKLECPKEFVEFFNQKKIDAELPHIKKFIVEKMHNSIDIEEQIFGANLTCLSPEYTEKINNFESEFNLKFKIINNETFQVKLNDSLKVDINYDEKFSKDEEKKLKYVENLKNPNETKYDNDDYNNHDDDDFESTEIDDEAFYFQKVVIDFFGKQKEFEIHKNPAQVIYIDNKPFIVINNIAYEKQPNSPFMIGNMVNTDNSPENCLSIKSKNYVEIIIGSHREEFEISDLKLFSFENYCIGPDNYAYLLFEHAHVSFF